MMFILRAFVGTVISKLHDMTLGSFDGIFGHDGDDDDDVDDDDVDNDERGQEPITIESLNFFTVSDSGGVEGEIVAIVVYFIVGSILYVVCCMLYVV